jgi:hypothetical protein
LVSGLALAAVLGGASQANPPATKPTSPPSTKLPAFPAPADSAPERTKDDNPLEGLAKGLGAPAGVLALLGSGWFLFTRGKPIQENKKAWEEILQTDNQPEKGVNEHQANNMPVSYKRLSVKESDLIKELEITQEMQEIGAIKETNAIFIQAQKIAEIRILRSSKP